MTQVCAQLHVPLMTPGPTESVIEKQQTAKLGDLFHASVTGAATAKLVTDGLSNRKHHAVALITRRFSSGVQIGCWGFRYVVGVQIGCWGFR